MKNVLFFVSLSFVFTVSAGEEEWSVGKSKRNIKRIVRHSEYRKKLRSVRKVSAAKIDFEIPDRDEIDSTMWVFAARVNRKGKEFMFLYFDIETGSYSHCEFYEYDDVQMEINLFFRDHYDQMKLIPK